MISPPFIHHQLLKLQQNRRIKNTYNIFLAYCFLKKEAIKTYQIFFLILIDKPLD
jgi:hypothetical protein